MGTGISGALTYHTADDGTVQLQLSFTRNVTAPIRISRTCPVTSLQVLAVFRISANAQCTAPATERFYKRQQKPKKNNQLPSRSIAQSVPLEESTPQPDSTRQDFHRSNRGNSRPSCPADPRVTCRYTVARHSSVVFVARVLLVCNSIYSVRDGPSTQHSGRSHRRLVGVLRTRRHGLPDFDGTRVRRQQLPASPELAFEGFGSLHRRRKSSQRLGIAERPRRVLRQTEPSDQFVERRRFRAEQTIRQPQRCVFRRPEKEL